MREVQFVNLAVGLMPSGITPHRPPEAFITAGLTIELRDKSDISVRGSIFRVQPDDTIKHLEGEVEPQSEAYIFPASEGANFWQINANPASFSSTACGPTARVSAN